MRKSLIYDLKQTQLLIHAPLRASLPDERETLVFDIKNTGREATQTVLFAGWGLLFLGCHLL